MDSLNNLYKSSRGAFLPQPDAQQLWRAGRDGLLFVVEGFEPGHDDRMLGAAGLFRLATCRTTGKPEVEVFEVAGMVLRASLQGYGLQKVLLALRTVALARFEKSNMIVLASVIDGNVASVTNVERMGFLRVESRPWLADLHRSWTKPHETVVDYVLQSEALANHARLLLHFSNDSHLRRFNKDKGWEDHVRVEVDVKWFHSDTEALISLADGMVPSWERVLPTHRLIGESPDWLKIE